MTNDDLHTLKIYEEKLLEGRSNRTHPNQFIVCYRRINYMLFRFYCGQCSVCVCVCVLIDQGRIKYNVIY